MIRLIKPLGGPQDFQLTTSPAKNVTYISVGAPPLSWVKGVGNIYTYIYGIWLRFWGSDFALQCFDQIISRYTT